MKELVVISGKGGTGKTSIAASLAVLAGRCVVADCDVDAADLHLVLAPQIRQRHEFRSGHEAVVREEDCTGCGLCRAHCRFGAVRPSPAEGDVRGVSSGARFSCSDCDYCRRSCPAQANAAIREMREAIGESVRGGFVVDPIACEGCGVCVRICPEQAIDFPERVCGEWFVSETRCGPMVHAKLGIAQSNSGKLVSLVRQNARSLAQEHGADLVIIDGSPGIGCPVIASVTGASLVLAVTEPTLSGEHDLKRVVQLARHFGVPVAVCVNKWDVNPGMAEAIESFCRKESITMAGRVRYDAAFTRAQVQCRTVVEAVEGGVSADVRALWAVLAGQLRIDSRHWA